MVGGVQVTVLKQPVARAAHSLGTATLVAGGGDGVAPAAAAAAAAMPVGRCSCEFSAEELEAEKEPS